MSNTLRRLLTKNVTILNKIPRNDARNLSILLSNRNKDKLFFNNSQFSPLSTINKNLDTNQKPSPEEKELNEPGPSYCLITGFSRFVSRLDLELVLGKNLPERIDPVLDRYNLQPTGKYLLVYPSNKSVNDLRRHISQNFPQKFRLEHGNPLVLKILESWILASSKNIGRNSVRIFGLPKDVDISQIEYWLEDYELFRPGAIRKEISNNFIVDCANSDEAQRLVAEKSTTTFEGWSVSLLHYQA